MDYWRKQRVLAASALFTIGPALFYTAAAAAEDLEPPPDPTTPLISFPSSAQSRSGLPPATPVALGEGDTFEIVLSARPAPVEPPPSPGTGGEVPAGVPDPPPSTTPGDPSEEDLAALRACEAGGDYSAVSYGGWYRGAYQFNQETWDSVASRWNPSLVGVDPAMTSPADQDAMARALYRERGWAPWPTCGASL